MYFDCTGACLADADVDGICDELELAGCTEMDSCNYNSDATDDDGSCDGGPDNTNFDCDGNCVVGYDCEGECGGTSAIDMCDVCDDDSSNDCVEDCAGDWGGNAQTDQCETCLDGTQGDDYECTADCSGIWGGDLEEDCAGDCDGSAMEDECGVCDGDGSDDVGCGCFEAAPDACGTCDASIVDLGCGCGEAAPDACGTCDASIADLGCGCGEAAPDACGTCDASIVDLGCGCGEEAAAENFDCDGNCIADLDYCGECAGDNSTCATYPTVLTAEEWSAVSVDQYDETCTGESTGSTSGPFDLGEQECDSITITFKSDGSFNAVCETSIIPIPVPGSWVIYNDNTLCLAVGDDSDCTNYTYYEEEGTFGLSGFGDDGNCYETVFQYTSTLAIDEFGIPTDFSVDQNYPNPFNPSTTIEFDVAISSNISLVVYDLMGKEIYSLASGYHVPGRYSVVWNANDSNGEEVSSGMYIYQLRTSDTVLTKKLVLLR